MKKLTLDILETEYKTWTDKYGQGRDDQGVRFGQHLWIEYDLNGLFDITDPVVDGFGDSLASEAYGKIYTQLVIKNN